MIHWLELISIVSLVAAVLSSLMILFDIIRGHKQPMAIMNLVWPITGLYSGPLGLWIYFKIGRIGSVANTAAERGPSEPNKKPFWQSVAVGATHCGSGCALGDLIAEWFIFFVPLTLFGSPVFAAWSIDYILALMLGIAFQYFAIMPMRKISMTQGLIAALKADVISLTAWQVGMYGWMAIVVFVIFRHELSKTSAIFWFMMQLAMIAGFVTSYPVNWWLLRKGIKEVM